MDKITIFGVLDMTLYEFLSAGTVSMLNLIMRNEGSAHEMHYSFVYYITFIYYTLHTIINCSSLDIIW